MSGKIQGMDKCVKKIHLACVLHLYISILIKKEKQNDKKNYKE